MTLKQCLEYLDKESIRGSVYGLNAINLLLDRLNRPEKSLKIIHIAGTNGKGSVSNYISNILSTTYSVGTFNSPCVFSYNESFLINTKPVSDEILEKNLSFVIDEVQKMKQENIPFIPTVFEIEFATALMIFKNLNLEFAIIECGMGGKNDATNAISNKLVSVITSISLDHIQLLGDSLEKIAEEKVGICTNNLITIKQNPIVMKVFKKHIRPVVAKNATCLIANSSGQTFKYKFDTYKIQMLGEHQLQNASLAICCINYLRKLGYPVKKANIKEGLFKTKLSGRCEKITLNNKTIILDGSHNMEGARALSKFIKTNFNNKSKTYVFSCFKDKDIDNMLLSMKDDCNIHIFQIPTKRGLPLNESKNICEKYFNNVITNTSVSEAISNALNEPSEVIVIFGSLSILKDAKEYIRGIINGQKQN